MKIIYTFVILILTTTVFANNTINYSDKEKIEKIKEAAASNPHLQNINYLIGIYYMAGDVKNNIKPDFKKAMKYFLKDSNNIANANYRIAELYFYGYGTKKDLKKAIYYLEKAMDKKFVDYEAVRPIALVAIGRIYAKELKKPEKAIPYLLEAAQKYDKVEAQLALAFMFRRGEGVKENTNEANHWIQKAYFNKNADGNIKAYISNFVVAKGDFDIENDVKQYCGMLN